MARPKKNPPDAPAAEADEFDVPAPSSDSSPPSPPQVNDAVDECDEPEEENDAVPVQAIESPEQRKLMREKRIAKAEEEQLRRLTRQFPIVARLVAENQALRKQLEGKN